MQFCEVFRAKAQFDSNFIVVFPRVHETDTQLLRGCQILHGVRAVVFCVPTVGLHETRLAEVGTPTNFTRDARGWLPFA